MKTQKFVKITAALALAIGLVAVTVVQAAEKKGEGKNEQDGKKVTLADVPAPVRAAIKAATAGGTIKEIEQEDEDGKTVYDVDATVNGKDMEIKVAANGTILSNKEDKDGGDKKDEGENNEQDGKKVTLSDVPAPVRAAIKAATAGGTIKEIEQEDEDGKTVYDVDATVNGKDLEIKVAADGTILSNKEDKDGGEKD